MPEKVKETSFFVDNPLVGWARQGIESFMAAQKILLDLTAQQNALVIGMLRERLSEPPRPGVALSKIADKGIENVANAGKILLDLAAAETELMVQGVKEVVPLPVTAGTLANVWRHRVITLIDLQKRFLETAAKQTHAAAESYQEGKGLVAAGTTMAGLVRQTFENLVANERKFLDMVVHEVSAANGEEPETHKPARERYKVVAQMARESGEKYIEAQKKLLNLAVEQMESVGKGAAGVVRSTREAATRTSLGELTEKSVRNFVSAQKSLMDLVTKSEKATPAPRVERKRKAARVRPKPSKEKAEEQAVA